MSGPIALMRAAAARRAAAVRYLGAYERFAELEQLLLAKGSPIDAAGAHEFALRALRAHLAEIDDPRPDGLRDG